MNTDVTEQDYELLSRYLDSELDAEEEREVRRRLLAEPHFRSAHDRLAAVDSRLRAALDTEDAGMVPDRVREMVEAAPVTGNTGKRLGWGFGLAASVLFGAGVVLNQGQQQADSALYAVQDALVAPVLERSVSRGEGWESSGEDARVRPLLSFPVAEGGWCREYLLARDGAAWRGVACRTADGWETVVLAAEDQPAGLNAYRPAGAATPDAVASFIDAHSADIPLSREQEAELISRGWQ